MNRHLITLTKATVFILSGHY